MLIYIRAEDNHRFNITFIDRFPQAGTMAHVLQLRLLAAARKRDKVPQQGPCRLVWGLQHPPRGPSQSGDGGRAANLQACECRTPRGTRYRCQLVGIARSHRRAVWEVRLLHCLVELIASNVSISLSTSLPRCFATTWRRCRYISDARNADSPSRRNSHCFSFFYNYIHPRFYFRN